ncbi:MAG: cytochrome c maturation protein CcmE [Candidatus Nitrotoga sp.]|nr:cytochrome c maturation protein CcmE [Candidatus Nitrotoga sp.]MBP0117336.1 cytochrome c maturation protein CcmE [Candidatus Nitrotoga sp.]MBP0123091.1 cytochrome c maturation protein CcmE [Candidatus Nitrotoga sp.]MBP0125730.1 cytochrome c maturation protein CcmE [Candidatus Nitrotoga sp.]
MKPRHKKFTYIILALLALSAAVGLVLYALSNNISLYFTPTQVLNKEAPQGRSFRMGGLVVANSLKRQEDGLTVHFNVTDTVKSMSVVYKGFLPDLFKEGKGVVVHGKLETDGVFRADEVLAKHDENYIAPEAAYAIKQAKKGQPKANPTSPLGGVMP